MIIKSDYRIPSYRDGYGILLRNKHLNDEDHRFPDHPVLFVHGATYGSSDTFDFEIEGESWMDQLAKQGFDTWCLDLLGYGQSDRPAEMNAPAEQNEPLVDTAHAVAEVDRAVDFILKDRGASRVSLIGYSWGTAICGRYTGQFPGKVEKLALSGALWVEANAVPRTIQSTPGAYRTVDVASMMSRWATGLDDGLIDDLVSEPDRQRWCEATVRCDPDFETTGLMRAPTGVLKDFMQCAETGEPWYDPGLIASPVQIVVGELDRETTPEQGRQVFDRLTGAAAKRMTVIGGGTHSLLLENNRHALYDVVSGFLSD